MFHFSDRSQKGLTIFRSAPSKIIPVAMVASAKPLWTSVNTIDLSTRLTCIMFLRDFGDIICEQNNFILFFVVCCTHYPESSNMVTISILSHSGDLKSGLVELLKKIGQIEVGLLMV